MLATVIAQHTKEFDLDREDKLAQVKKYAESALELLKTAPKPNPNLPTINGRPPRRTLPPMRIPRWGSPPWCARSTMWPKPNSRLALDTAAKPDPATMVRLGRAYRDDGKYDDAIAQFDKVMAIPEASMQVRQVAQAERVRAFQKKKAAAKPADAPGATPAAPRRQTRNPEALDIHYARGSGRSGGRRRPPVRRPGVPAPRADA